MRVLCVANCYVDRYYEEGKEYPDYKGPASPHLQPIEEDVDETAEQPGRRNKKHANKQGS